MSPKKYFFKVDMYVWFVLSFFNKKKMEINIAMFKKWKKKEEKEKKMCLKKDKR